MLADQLAIEESEKLFNSWMARFCEIEVIQEVAKYAARLFKTIPAKVYQPMRGSFNICLRIKLPDGHSIIIRFPNPGTSKFIEEKIRSEAAVHYYLQTHTTIPIPRLHYVGTAKESPCGLGPFLVLEYIEHHGDMADAMDYIGAGPKKMPQKDDEWAAQKLRYLYDQVADFMLQLSKCEFDKIGSLGGQFGPDKWGVVSRPHTLEMASLVGDANFPRSKLPSGTFDTTSQYFKRLSQLHIDHLSTQRNDAVDSGADCRKKYVARLLIRKVAKYNGLGHAHLDKGPFKLWNEDLRPTNILLNKDMKIVGVIDWEFTYAAPVEFSHAPPWWLLIQAPGSWETGAPDWVNNYQDRLAIFLKILEEKECELFKKGKLSKTQVLSPYMRESWSSGDFWTMFALRRPFCFDEVFWRFLNRKFYGNDGNTLKERLWLLTLEEIQEMEPFVSRKMEELKRRKFIKWDEE